MEIGANDPSHCSALVVLPVCSFPLSAELWRR